MHPPGPEKGEAGTLDTPGFLEKLNSDDAENLSQTPATCKKKTPPGYGWEAGKLVPFAPDESDEADSSEHLEFYRRFLILLEWALGDELSPKLAAMRVVLNQDRRDAKTIATSLGVVPELVRLRVREARKVLASARQVGPSPGDGKP